MKKTVYAFVLSLFVLVVFVSCKSTKEGSELSVIVTGSEEYVSAAGKELSVKFYALSDQSLDFIKVQDSEGNKFTCARVISASGARYSDEISREFWFKGDSLSVFVSDNSGSWNKDEDYSVKK
ncbi:MliC family protein [Treponema parvum]|uniref:MliC family protein n=1 Tax=Treponema parvum TaxID=138851 RepID=A0A975F166_9SPIR|nr:MliC family protein [Treponema parvum]QTQ12385.1 MliC family protein [Treponema parvum]QTQ15622.1 MliC family protein [Treponema parvum]